MEDQRDAVAAVGNFLKINGYDSLLEASERRSVDFQTLWNEIMRDAGVPEHEPPEIIPRHGMEDIQDELSRWPQFIPLPEPGQDHNDDKCPHISLLIATLDHFDAFLDAETDYVNRRTQYKMRDIVRVARHLGAKGNDSLFEFFGIIEKDDTQWT